MIFVLYPLHNKPSLSITCYAVLSASFGNKGPHLRGCLVAQFTSVLVEVFWGVSSAIR